MGSTRGWKESTLRKLNYLVESLTGRPFRETHGNFFVEGAKTGKDTRYGQLGDLFSLLSRLENLKETLNQYIALHAAKETAPAEDRPACQTT